MGEISLVGINKTYPNGTVAVRDVDLSIDDGEFVVFVGPSGCGKSTLLRMIAGLESITSGDVSIDGIRINDVAPSERDIAMVFQSYALYPHMTVQNNIAFSLKQRRMPRSEIKTRVAEAARILDLTELLGRRPKQLSGGQRQRVAMGRAIVRHPRAFLLDEPLSNLDAKLRVQMRAELGRLHSRLGVTTIHVTHDQVEAMTLGSRVAVFCDGTLQQYDTPHNLYHHPANMFVASFIGSPGMNFLRADVVQSDPLVIAVGDATLELGSPPMQHRVGAHLVVGIRPEHLAWRSAGEGIGIRAQVELVEHIEPESYVVLVPADPSLSVAVVEHAGGAPRDEPGPGPSFTMRTRPADAPGRGDDVELILAPDHLHIFDPETGTSWTTQ